MRGPGFFYSHFITCLAAGSGHSPADERARAGSRDQTEAKQQLSTALLTTCFSERTEGQCSSSSSMQALVTL